MKRYWKVIVAIVAVAIFPFIIEWFLFTTPEVSRFSNEVWFSFIASYSGAIATLIVLGLTILENQRNLKDEKERLKRNYETEKEIDLSKKIINVLLLNNYDFITRTKILTEYDRYIKDIYDVQFEVRELMYDENGNTARDKFFVKLFQIERYHSLQLAVQDIPEIKNEEKAKKYFDSIVDSTNKLSHQMTNERKLILDLYKDYVSEMKQKEFE